MADKLVGATRAALGQGLGMGWGDEAEAWLRSKLGQGNYDDLVGQIRSEQAMYSKENPFISGASEFAGGVLPGVAMMMVPGGQAAGASQLGKSGLWALAKLSGLGAATGAVSGAGSADERDRLSGAVSGATLGGIIGAGAPIALRSAGAAGRWLRERIAPSEKLIERRAAEKMTKAMQQEQMTPQQIERALAADAGMSVPSVVANVNPALVDLAETVAQRTGAGARKVERTLQEQKLGSRERTHQQVQKGLKPGNFYEDEQRLVSELRKKAKTVYDDAYAVGEVNDPKLMGILDLPELKSAYDTARKIANADASAAKARGEDPSKYLLKEVYSMSVDPVTKVISAELKTLPDVRTLDYMKKALDAQIQAGYRSDNAATLANASAMKDIRNELRDRLKDIVPEYKKALSEYRGDMEVIDAMRAGMKDFGKMDHEQVIKLVGGMSQAEKDAFRTGVSRDLYSKIMDPSGNFNSAQRIIGSPETQAKLQPLFDSPGQFDLFKTALQREAQLFGQANQILGGSQTGKRMQMRQEFESGSGVGDAIAGAVTGGFWGGLTGLVSRSIRSANMTDEVAGKLSTMLMSKDPHEVAAVVKLLEQHAAEAAPKAFRAGATERGVVTGTTSTIWPSRVPEDSSSIEDESPVRGLPLGPGIEDDVK